MPERFVDLTDGIAMIVTDLHGDRDAFHRYLTRFRRLHQAGEAQRLIFLGDLIHSYGSPQSDASLSMVLDVIALQREVGSDTVMMLLGNHEVPHIYGMSLVKGEIEFTPRFEHALGPHRDTVLAFFGSLPFYVRTAAGVILTHTGPALKIAQHVALLREFDHQAILQDADHVLHQTKDLGALFRQYGEVYGGSYDEEIDRFLAVSDPGDPRYPHLLRALVVAHQSGAFQTLWDVLFNQNELGLSEPAYLQCCRDFLSALSVGAPAKQQVIVSGHIVTPVDGYTLINRHHLRLSSAAHARPREAARYLLLDCAKPVRAANELLGALGSVFEPDSHL
ncbi:MAG TPA: metallophosphoesterase [Aggregatilineaceae bacterium]|jgi:hypothetical protein|nr:metallophosphoesterase [Aggregatilineaceae bacterium]